MGYLSRSVSRVDGRGAVLLLGGLYVAFAVGFPVTPAAGGRSSGDVLITSVLVGGCGLVLLYSGYLLPRASIRPELYDVVAGWCLRGIGVMLGIVLFGILFASIGDAIAAFVTLPALASAAGLGMGYHDARARTRALDAENRRREAEQYSRELERYETIVETVNDGIFILDEDRHFTLVNDAYTELVGYDREELLGSPASLVADEATDVETMAEGIQRDLAAGTAETKTYESTIRTADGERREVESTVALLPEQADASQDKVVVVRDITERNRRERRLKEQNERLESFAGMLAHELRNPVNIGQIYGQQLPADTGSTAVEYVTEAFDRIENIIDVMLVITRGHRAVSGSAPVQLSEVTREVWTEMDAPEATLEVTTDQAIEVDETYVRHLFRNLFENAVKHGGHDVTVTVGDLPTGFYVADDGAGIPADDREDVFETGYTTADGRGGMGLGLTFIKEMSDVYGWECSVTESAGGGARFEFVNVTRAQSVTD